MQTKKSEIWVGAFLIIALIAVIFLCLKVADIRSIGSDPTYRISADFDNIGGLKSGSPVKVGGVVIGRVSSITLDKNYSPRVEMDIDQKYNQIPSTSTLAIRTSGLLGEQFLALNIGFEDPEMGTTILKNGGVIQDTKSAMVLEDLIGQFLYKSGDGKADPDATAAPAAPEGNAAPAPDANTAPQPAAH
ncbi:MULTISPECIES: outer membrane lipid asymmetry maintenance protein MlaD [Rahnella]|jgi:phospholipid/cholesterol/gamma-HCH transport system substrate-binding protein|uniref:Mammalian cell entry related domain protein n=1 Tax=Rahnella sp. (strain Y9602) TaxID=2703885 RepID=A0A0H3FE41_RAHSY|nr:MULTISPECIES: outer membrane lipid asymmetry maintenance protein MlaD [Rahnella]AFE60248.1 Mammalian cell entry related domain-containing protein [Rahnella aquatilis HX2]AYA08841.1 outer membrane lipid asymmetry maintenance protein MlaD [Rahnella aquatilis]ADW75560.1 Mammalian cell entry related domain protein [Rahnella aceris]AZP44015.1 outer membrane lipid asymmetry maintenance protein MlaD [Rahnella aquatilis]AZP48351.1 outer membrane lipid asymmetry maintenance protein MlaD [Rahnella aq